MTTPKINYPCQWCYTIIGTDDALLRNAAAEVFCGKEVTLALSKKSKGGKYISLSVEANVASEKERLNLFEKLAKHPAIKIVL